MHTRASGQAGPRGLLTARSTSTREFLSFARCRNSRHASRWPAGGVYHGERSLAAAHGTAIQLSKNARIGTTMGRRLMMSRSYALPSLMSRMQKGKRPSPLWVAPSIIRGVHDDTTSNRPRVIQIPGMMPLDLIDPIDLRNEIDRLERNEHARITPLRYCSFLVSCNNRKLRSRILKLVDRVSDPSSPESASNSYALLFQTLLKAKVAEHSELDDLVAGLLARMRDEEVPLNDRGLNSLISLYISHGDLDKARSLFDLIREGQDDWKIQPGLHSYTTLIRGLAAVADLPDALHYFEQMKSDRIKPDGKTYTALLQVCSAAKDLPQALQIWGDMIENGIAPDLYAFNTLINACNKALDLEAGIKIVDEMRIRWQLEPNVITYSLLVGLCAMVGDFAKAFEFINEMKKQGIEPDVHTYTSLITAYANAGDVEQCFSVLEKMREERIRPNAVTLKGLVTASLNAGDFREAVQTLGRLKRDYNVAPDAEVLRRLISTAGPKITTFDLLRLIERIEQTEGIVLGEQTYCELIALGGKRKELETAFLVHDRIQRNASPDGRARLDRALILACLQANEPQKALSIIDSIVERASITQDSSRRESENIGPEATLNVELFNSLLQQIGASAVESVVERMKIMRIPPDLETIDLLISHYESREQLDRLWVLLRELQDQRILQQDDIIYNSFIKVFLRRGDIAKAHAVLTQLLERDTILPPSTYHVFLESPPLTRKSTAEERARAAERAALIPELVEQMYSNSPSTLPITALIPFLRYCAERRYVERLDDLIQLLEQNSGSGKDLVERVLEDTSQERGHRGVNSSAVVMRHLGPVLKALVLLRKTDQAIALIDAIRQRGIRVNAHMYQSLVVLAGPESPGSALRLRALMRQDRVPELQRDPFAEIDSRLSQHGEARENESAQEQVDIDELLDGESPKNNKNDAEAMRLEKEKRAAEKKLRKEQRRKERREEMERLEQIRKKAQSAPRAESLVSLSLSLLEETSKKK